MQNTLEQIKEVINTLASWRVAGDGTSLMIILASFADWLPSVAALLSITWLLIRIYETDTLQQLLYRRKHELIVTLPPSEVYPPSPPSNTKSLEK